MSRLIDADKIQFSEIDEIGGEYEPYLGCSKSQIDNLPTVEAIPKDEYETRLKADMVAMLKELEKELKEVKCNYLATIYVDIAEEYFNLAKVEGLYLIQQKINELKEDQGGRMTNGEKIQQDFECEVCEPIIEDDLILVIFANKPYSAIGFDLSWWNMEYNDPTTKNDLGVDCVARQDVERFIEGFINEYTPEEELEFINLELDGLKHLPPVTPQEPKTGHCKDCKWWKDSDGKYRRGCGAESQCPINTHAVYCGEGYCYMFEPQESEG